MQIRKGTESLGVTFVQFATDESADTSAAISLAGYNSALLAIGWEFVASDTETLSYKVEIQDCATSAGTYSSFSTLKDTTVVKTATAATTYTGQSLLDINTALYNKYVKLKITATCSIGTGNVDFASTLILADASQVPVTHTF